MKIAVIPARGGSKRIPRKNIKLFAGKPMIFWPIKAALECELFDHVVVSTDDYEIAEIAKKAGAEVPFIRPAELSDDHTATRPVIRHAMQAVETETTSTVDFVCCIYATAAFTIADDLRKGFEALSEEGVLFSFAGQHTRTPFNAP